MGRRVGDSWSRVWRRGFVAKRGCSRALSYLRGLLAPLERKNGWQLAEAAGDVSPAAMQDFLTRTRWDADAVRDDLQDYVVEHLGDEAGGSDPR